MPGLKVKYGFRYKGTFYPASKKAQDVPDSVVEFAVKEKIGTKAKIAPLNKMRKADELSNKGL